ncbi:hypothetical protein FSP39_006831 [Pinctada imbricata]|uniref:Uncharacterized protein n=1 Tax=Pinctada imbricata TaxID=66713 RepID=A0AA88Y3Y9_PINIB|nr:hypothetical protein FSP39_006831 [Pinctada imbricata]
MPTSSQAMILKNRDIDEALWRKPSSRTVNPCHVNSVDINELFEQPFRDLSSVVFQRNLRHGSKYLKERLLSKVVKVNGYQTILSYDAENDSVSWKFIPEKTVPKNVQQERILFDKKHSTDGIIRPKTGITRQTDKGNLPNRPKSTAHIELLERETKNPSRQELPEDIVSLGFRDPQKKISRSAARGTSAPVINRQIHEQTDTETSSWIHIPSRAEDQYIKSTNLHKQSSERIEYSSDDLSQYEGEKYEDLCLPSSYQMKKLPKKRPLAVCFSLRNNEDFDHLELKNILSESTGLGIEDLQYEPLSIRTCDPSVNGRWLATMSSKYDVDEILRNGFYMGKDHVIVKRLDDLNERGYRNYNYMVALKEERNRLRLTKSAYPAIRTSLQSTKLISHEVAKSAANERQKSTNQKALNSELHKEAISVPNVSKSSKLSLRESRKSAPHIRVHVSLKSGQRISPKSMHSVAKHNRNKT